MPNGTGTWLHMPSMATTPPNRAPDAVKHAQFGDPVRTAEWLRRFLPDAGATSQDPAYVALQRVVGAAVVASAVETVTAEYVAEARELGATWEEVATCLGVTRQAAQQRYGPGARVPSRHDHEPAGSAEADTRESAR